MRTRRQKLIRLEPLCEVFMPWDYGTLELADMREQFAPGGDWSQASTRYNTLYDPSEPNTRLCWHLRVAQEVRS